MSAHGAHNGGYERQDIEPRPVGVFLLALTALVLVAMAVMWGTFEFLLARQKAADLAPPPLADTRPAQPPEPRLQANPALDWQQLREEETRMLNDYGWVDREAGVVRIPIERAMDLVAERGLPLRESAPGGAQPQRGRKSQ